MDLNYLNGLWRPIKTWALKTSSFMQPLQASSYTTSAVGSPLITCHIFQRSPRSKHERAESCRNLDQPPIDSHIELCEASNYPINCRLTREAKDAHKKELLGSINTDYVFAVIPICSFSSRLHIKSTQLNPQCTICTQYKAVKPFTRSSWLSESQSAATDQQIYAHEKWKPIPCEHAASIGQCSSRSRPRDEQS